MKSTVETLSPTRVRLSVEVPFEELTPHLTQAYQKVGAQVKVPGFRPGKAPRAVIDQRVGKDAIYAQAVDLALPQQLAEAFSTNEIKALGRPEITEMDMITEDKPFSFTAEVDVVPDFELPELAALEVTVDSTDVSDEAVDTEIENLRLRFGTLKSVDRAVQTGDFVTVDLVATIDGKEVEGGSTTGMSHEVGAGNLVEGLDDELVGMTVGEKRTFDTKLAGGDQAGDDAQVEVTVGSVKERELPDLDDDFAQLASEHDTFDELRDATRQTLADRARDAQGGQARENTADALVAAADIPVPEGVVDEEVKQRTEHLSEQLTSMGLELRGYLQSQGQTFEEFESEMRENATRGLRRQLVLDRLADDLKIEVTSEQLTAEVVRRAQQQGVSEEQFPQFAEMLRQRGLLRSIAGEVRRALALEEALKTAKITDGDGRELGQDVLFPNAEQDAEDTEDSDEAESKTE